MSTLRKSALVHRPEDATHWNNASEMITLMTRLGIWYGTDGVGARVDFQLQLNVQSMLMARRQVTR